MKKDKENIKFFDSWAGLYGFDPVTLWLRWVQNLVLKQVPVTSESSVLDVGCGPGYGLSFFQKHGVKTLAGIDISPKMIARARKKVNAVLKVASVEKIPFSGNSFDFVANTESFHHFSRPDKALKEIFRVLKPNGRLFLADINFFFSFVHFLFKKLEPGHVKIYSKKELAELFKRTGFKIVHQKRLAWFVILTIGERKA